MVYRIQLHFNDGKMAETLVTHCGALTGDAVLTLAWRDANRQWDGWKRVVSGSYQAMGDTLVDALVAS